ncbi:MAG: Crp/Fnr family transcriptional regulator [Ktedonobacteraceae bacterium]|nr:Crp/Fnr family transcriptional regulator [Ktedonobacteraceae bacterium]
MQEKQSPDQQMSTSSHVLSERAAFLASSDIFGHLQSTELGELERLATVITCPPGRIFYRPGEKGATLFLLRTGSVQLYYISQDGRKLITATLETGASFGELSLFGQTLHTSFAETVTSAQLYIFNRQDIDHLVSQRPTIALGFLHALAQRFTQLEAQLIDTTFRSTASRLAALLLQLAHTQDNALVVEGLSHEELAERLGVYRETVSAVLRELKDAGTIISSRKHITISQPAQLKEIATL